MNKKISTAIALLFVVTCFTSCYKDKFDLDKLSTDIKWNPNVAVPVIHSSLSIRDLLQDYDTNEVFIYDQTGFLYLMYHKQVFSIPASDYITLPDQNFSDNFVGNDFLSQGFPATYSSKTITKNYTHTLVVGSPSDAFDSLVVKSGTFTLNVNSTFLHAGSLLITFPFIKKNGVPYSKTVTVNLDDGTFTYTNSFNDLTGYTIDFTNPTFNQIPVILSLTLNRTTGHVVTAAHQANVSISFSGMQYSILYGDIGQRSIPIQEDTVNIKLFNSTINGQIYFMDPKFRLYIHNSFGVPLQANFNDFKIWSNATNSFNTFTFPSAYNPLMITAPISPNLPPTLTTVQLDTTNFPTISTIVSEFPRYVYLQTTATSNPPSMPQYNFIKDTSKFSVDLEVELPLWGRASWWVLQDTLDFDFSKYYKDSVVDLDNIEWVKFHININNGLPTEAGVQLFFTDSLYNVKDTIFSPQNMQVVESGVLGQNGKVVAATRKITDVIYTSSRLSHLTDVKKVLVRGYVKTSNAGSTNVRFYEDYALDVKVGLQVQAKINIGHDL
jgi:hypothetical protein